MIVVFDRRYVAKLFEKIGSSKKLKARNSILKMNLITYFHQLFVWTNKFGELVGHF